MPGPDLITAMESAARSLLGKWATYAKDWPQEKQQQLDRIEISLQLLGALDDRIGAVLIAPDLGGLEGVQPESLRELRRRLAEVRSFLECASVYGHYPYEEFRCFIAGRHQLSLVWRELHKRFGGPKPRSAWDDPGDDDLGAAWPADIPLTVVPHPEGLPARDMLSLPSGSEANLGVALSYVRGDVASCLRLTEKNVSSAIPRGYRVVSIRPRECHEIAGYGLLCLVTATVSEIQANTCGGKHTGADNDRRRYLVVGVEADNDSPNPLVCTGVSSSPVAWESLPAALLDIFYKLVFEWAVDGKYADFFTAGSAS